MWPITARKGPGSRGRKTRRATPRTRDVSPACRRAGPTSTRTGPAPIPAGRQGNATLHGAGQGVEEHQENGHRPQRRAGHGPETAGGNPPAPALGQATPAGSNPEARSPGGGPAAKRYRRQRPAPPAAYASKPHPGRLPRTKAGEDGSPGTPPSREHLADGERMGRRETTLLHFRPQIPERRGVQLHRLPMSARCEDRR